MRTNRFADLIEYGADNHLRVVPSDAWVETRISAYSCDAVSYARDLCIADPIEATLVGDVFKALVLEMGCDAHSTYELDEIEFLEAQQIRHSWLYLVAQVAREDRIGEQFNDFIKIPETGGKMVS